MKRLLPSYDCLIQGPVFSLLDGAVFSLNFGILNTDSSINYI